jgi:hypothetical protein
METRRNENHLRARHTTSATKEAFLPLKVKVRRAIAQIACLLCIYNSAKNSALEV